MARKVQATITISEEDVEQLIEQLRTELDGFRARLPPVVMKGPLPDIEVERVAATMRAASQVRCATVIETFISKVLATNGIAVTEDARLAVQDGMEKTRAWARHVVRA